MRVTKIDGELYSTIPFVVTTPMRVTKIDGELYSTTPFVIPLPMRVTKIDGELYSTIPFEVLTPMRVTKIDGELYSTSSWETGFSYTMSGGLILSGNSACTINLKYTMSGGFLLGGSASSSFSENNSFRYTMSGGLVLGGSSDYRGSNSYDYNMSGGGIFGGIFVHTLTPPDPTCSSCNGGCLVDHTMSGGGKFGGTSQNILSRYFQGGGKFGGTAISRVLSKCYEGFNYIIPLNDRTDYPEELVQDLTTVANNTVLAKGVFCLPGFEFFSEKNSSVAFEHDTLKLNQSFTVSFWVLPKSRFQQRCLWSRGFNPYSVAISKGYLNHVVLSVINDNGDSFEKLSNSKLDMSRWNHVAVTYDNSQFKLYINGVYQFSLAITGRILPSLGNSIGSLNNQSHPDAIIQEVRCYNYSITADHILNEYRNFCDFENFVEFGNVETPSVV